MATTEDGCEKTDRKQWLTDNKLEDAITVFEKRNVEIEELLDFDNEDLKEFAKDVLLLDVLAKNRFIKAINKLKDMKNKNKPNIDTFDFNFNFNSEPQSIVISHEESQVKESLYQRNNEIAKLCYNITTAINNELEKSYSNVLIEIDNIFNVIISKLNSKKQQLIIDINNIEKQKMDTLQKQLSSLNEYIPKLNNTKQQYYKYIEDKNLDIFKLISNTLNSNEYGYALITQANIQFNISTKTLNEFINKMEISNCDEPYPPYIIITKCTPTSITIKWEFKIYIPDSIEIQYAILPNNIYNDEERSKGKKRSFLSSILGTNKNNNGERYDIDSANQRDIENDDSNSYYSESETVSDNSDDNTDDDSDYQKQNKKKRGKKRRDKGKKEKHSHNTQLTQLTLDLANDIDIDSLKWKSICKNKSKMKCRKYNYYEIEELNHNRFYVFRVRGSNENGYGIYSKCIVGKTKKLIFKSKIIKASEQRKLLNILKKNKKRIRFNNKIDVNCLGWKLLFRASKYNYNWSDFYRKCKGKKNTLVIALSDSNNVFGGYVNIAWQQPPQGNWVYGNDKDAFLFILRSNNKSDIGIYNIQKQYSQFAICNWDQYGPCFGQNCEIAIANACNVSTSNYSQLGTYGGLTHEGQLAGTQYFKVTDYEVWQLQQ